MSPQVQDVPSRLAVLESEHKGIASRVEDYHARLGELEQLAAGMNSTINSINEKVDRILALDERLRKVENWQSNQSGRFFILGFVWLSINAIITGVIVKALTTAPTPQPRIAPLDYNSLPIDRDGSPKWPTR